MAYLQSPADPIFFSHHAFIDALQVIYLKCQNGGEGVLLTAAQKSNDARFWSNCTRRTSGTFQASDNVTMRTRSFNSTAKSATWVNVRTSPNHTLYPFFKDLPATYQEYVDAKDLGNYSYSYEISGAMANMYTNCNASNTISAAANLTTTTSLMENSESQHSCPRPQIVPSTVTDVTIEHWTIAIFEAARIVGYTDDAAREQMELIMCQHKEECLGGTEDYTDLFRTNFMVEGHPRCYTLIQDLKTGDRVIGVPKWRSITARFLPCSSRKRMIIRSSIE
jgi:tyrosinase